MTKFTLYLSPGACSRVTLHALEECGVSYDAELVNAMAGENYAADYLAINPKGKIPALAIDGNVLTENAAILYHLHSHFPKAKLLPTSTAVLGDNTVLEDLTWCSSFLHPLTRMVRMPMRFAENNSGDVKALGLKNWQSVLQNLEQRFTEGKWWYGEQWSIIDTYIYWAYMVAASGGLDISSHPAILQHMSTIQQLAGYKNAIARETQAMTAWGIDVPVGWK